MSRTPLLSYEEFKTYSRPVSSHLDESEVKSFIRECEDMFIIPPLGWKHFKSACGDSTWDSSFDATFNPDIFLTGAEWCENLNGEEKWHYCNGVKKALSYFVYAKMLRADGTIVTRAGAMRHMEQYGDHIDDTKLSQYNDIMSIAETYLSECMQYLKYHIKDKQVKKFRGSRCHVHAIGN